MHSLPRFLLCSSAKVPEETCAGIKYGYIAVKKLLTDNMMKSQFVQF